MSTVRPTSINTRHMNTSIDTNPSSSHLPRGSPSPRYRPSLTPRSTTPRGSSYYTSRSGTPRGNNSGERATRLASPRGGTPSKASPVAMRSGGTHSRFGRRFVVTGDHDDLDAVSVLTESTTQSAGRCDIFSEHDVEERLQRYKSASIPRTLPMSPHYERSPSEYSTARFVRSSEDDDDDGRSYHGGYGESHRTFSRHLRTTTATNAHRDDEDRGHERTFSDNARSLTKSVRSGTSHKSEEEDTGRRFAPESTRSMSRPRLVSRNQDDEDAPETRGRLGRTFGSTLESSRHGRESRDDVELTGVSHDEESRSLFTEQAVARKARTDLEKALMTVETVSSARSGNSGNSLRENRLRENENQGTGQNGTSALSSTRNTLEGDGMTAVRRRLRFNTSGDDTSSAGFGLKSNKRGGVSQCPSSSTIVQEFESADAKVDRDNESVMSEQPRYLSRGEYGRNREKGLSDFRSTLGARATTRIREETENQAEKSSEHGTNAKSAKEEELEKTLETTKSEVTMLERSLESSKSEVAMLERSLAVKDRSVESLKSELSELTSTMNEKLHRSQMELERLRREDMDNRHRLSEQENDKVDLERLKREEMESRRRIKQQDEELEGIRQQLEEAKMENGELRDIQNDLESQLEECRSELDRAESRAKSERSRLEENNRNTILDLQEKLSRTTTELSTAKIEFESDIEALQNENMALKSQLNELKCQPSSEDFGEIQGALSAKEEEADSLQREIENMRATMEKMQMESKKTAEMTKSLQIDVEEAKQDNDELKKELKTKSDEFQKSKETTEEYEAKLRESHATIMTLKSALLIKEQTCASLKTKVAESQKEADPTESVGSGRKLGENASNEDKVALISDKTFEIEVETIHTANKHGDLMQRFSSGGSVTGSVSSMGRYQRGGAMDPAERFKGSGGHSTCSDMMRRYGASNEPENKYGGGASGHKERHVGRGGDSAERYNTGGGGMDSERYRGGGNRHSDSMERYSNRGGGTESTERYSTRGESMERYHSGGGSIDGRERYNTSSMERYSGGGGMDESERRGPTESTERYTNNGNHESMGRFSGGGNTEEPERYGGGGGGSVVSSMPHHSVSTSFEPNMKPEPDNRHTSSFLSYGDDGKSSQNYLNNLPTPDHEGLGTMTFDELENLR